MASPKKASRPRRPLAVRKEGAPDARSGRSMTSGPTALQVVSPTPPADPEVSERTARRRAELERENTRLTRRLQQAETIIAVQKKLSEALGIALPSSDGSC